MIKISDGSTIVQINANAYAAGANAAAAAETSAAAAVASVAKLHVYDSVADMQAATNYTPNDTIRLRSYYANGEAGGGDLIYDSTSTEAVDSGRVFDAAPYVGRFRREKGSYFLASEHGIVDHATTDQQAKLQSWIVACINEGWTGFLDVLQANAGGGELWFNVDGNEASYASGGKVSFQGHIARHSRILNAAVTIGKFYNDEGHAAPSYTIDRGPTTRGMFRDLHFEGALRVVNIEGGGALTNCSVFAETANTSFYDAVPAGWGENMSGRNDADDNALATTAYTDFTHVVELINCNHFQNFNMNVQKGLDVTNIAGDNLGAMRVSGCANPVIIGGRYVDSTECIRLESHSIYGGSNNTNVLIQNVHSETISETAFAIEHVQGLILNDFGRPDNAWAGTDPFIKLGNSALIQNVHINTNTNGIGNGTYLEADNFDGLRIGGQIKDFTNGIVLNGGTNLHEITTRFETVTNEISIDPSVTLFTAPAEVMRIAAMKDDPDTRSFSDDFVGHAINPSWREYTGAGITTDGVADGWEVSFAGGAPKDMTRGYKLATTGAFKPTDGRIFCGGSFLSSSTSNNAWIGLSDQPGDDLFPALIGSGNVITPSASNDDFAGFVYCRDATDDFIYCVTRRNAGTATAFETTLVPSATTHIELFVDVDSSGNATFYADGVELTTVSNAVSASADLAMTVAAFTNSTTAQDVTLRRASVVQKMGK